MELEQEGFAKLAGKIIDYCRLFLANIGSLPHLQQGNNFFLLLCFIS
jgi:hypothetical protein